MTPFETTMTPRELELPAASAEELDAMYTVAHMLYERADYARAADVLRFVVLADPLRSDAWWALASCHEQVEDHEVAATLYDVGFRLSDRSELGLLCARAWVKAGEHAAAREMLGLVASSDASPEVTRKCEGIRQMMGDR
jgi:hypothetical protein